MGSIQFYCVFDRESTNPAMSNNGGDYDFGRTVAVQDGVPVAVRYWTSADFDYCIGGGDMPEHFILREDELLARFNALPGVCIERRTFGRYIRPLMVDPRRNEARQAATGRTQPWVYDPTLLWQWDEYLAVRAELIRRGEWGEKRPYSIEDLEGIALLGEHGNVTERLFPAQAEPLEVAGNAQPALAAWPDAPPGAE